MIRAHSCILAIAVFALVTIRVSDATAQTVLTFDDLGLPVDTIITDQYVDQGVLFSPQDGLLQLRTASSPIFPGDPVGLAEIPYSKSVIFADFLPGATSAGAWVDFGEVGSGVVLQAFDGPMGTGNLLGTATTTTESYLGLEFDNIKSIRFEAAAPLGATFLIDHFTFNLVPEPGTLSLLTIAGLLTFKRRNC